ncbi:glycine-rich domain-containing protein-like [Kiloniella laminariae]|uniref:Glycine-rich domain-containing protein-like n=1 Tax=Kiloniella laminariae TaxID=454162 RepID=A0ABT4LF18_9PROT|nr:glycine-rich domain-containing protein-like [Kiloniella laminariae]MCZ4279694.1 glycine-rich domain-containing protein-like [Kiloniella laminariae]
MELARVEKDLTGNLWLPLKIEGIRHLEQLEEVRDYIFTMDMSMIFFKMTNEESAGELGLLWEEEDAKFAINQYRQYLYLIRKYEANISPTLAIDAVWHNHILDTRKYVKDCQVIFGHYLHHFPYFGSRSTEDRRQLEIAFGNTQKLFLEEFGVDITQGT